MTVLQADRVDPPLVPGSPEWRREITASKVSAILSLSKWESPFSLWHRLAGSVGYDDEQTPEQSRGHFLEPAIANWLADQLGMYFRDGGCWRSRKYPFMVATPDRLAFDHSRAKRPRAIVEIKSSADWEDWGLDGSDEIPAMYRAQVVFQMATLGLKKAYVGVLLPRLQFRAYTLHFDQEEADWLIGKVSAFLDTLPGGKNFSPPPIDSHEATYQTLRELHPQINGEDQVVDLELARRFTEGIDLARMAKATEQAVKSEMADAMGDARRAVVKVGEKEIVVATRQAKGNGVPYVSAPKKLPALPEVAQ